MGRKEWCGMSMRTRRTRPSTPFWPWGSTSLLVMEHEAPAKGTRIFSLAHPNPNVDSINGCFATVADAEGDLAVHSTAIHDIGSHSFRKGTATFLSAMVGGPSPVSIYLRAGWSLGVQKRYILEGGGNDQLAGRAAAGLDINSVRCFGSLTILGNCTHARSTSTEPYRVLI